jgi:hypothetical protein
MSARSSVITTVLLVVVAGCGQVPAVGAPVAGRLADWIGYIQPPGGDDQILTNDGVLTDTPRGGVSESRR